jgi:hypothetical protein
MMQRSNTMLTIYGYAPELNMSHRQDETQLRIEAAKAFNKAYEHGKLVQLLSTLFRKNNQLQPLSTQPVDSRCNAAHIVSVPIRQIKGSLGRTTDFDAGFHPLSEACRSRWVSILTAILQNIPMPAVELMQVGPSYYVVDGHHRISVAKSLGQQAIDAQIIN